MMSVVDRDWAVIVLSQNFGKDGMVARCKEHAEALAEEVVHRTDCCRMTTFKRPWLRGCVVAWLH